MTPHAGIRAAGMWPFHRVVSSPGGGGAEQGAFPAVMAMASAPQNVTRTARTRTPAPPVRAARAPSSARNRSEVPETMAGSGPSAGRRP